MRTSHQQWAITSLLLVYFIAALWMAFRLPAHATPNELLNFEYIQVMRQIRGLPNRGLVDSEIRYTEWHQPPVYFSFAAFFGLAIPVPPSDVNPPPPIAVDKNPHYLATPRGNLNPVVHINPATTPLLYTSRVAAALLGLLGIAALYRAGRLVYGPWTGLLMASLLAFQPTYIHLSGSVNNDMPLTAVVAVVMASAIGLLHRQINSHRPPPWWTFFFLGLLSAAAILTKANGVFVLVFAGVVLLSHLLLYRQWRAWAAAVFFTLAGLVPLWASWLWLNTVRMRDALGLSGSLPVDRVLALNPLDFTHVVPFLPDIWRSYWLDWSAGDVGYGPDWLYLFWLGALLIMLLGWLRQPRAGSFPNERSTPPLGGRLTTNTLITTLVLLGFLGISYLYFAVKALTVKEAGWMVPEARWWLPGWPALAWLAAGGFARWWPTPPQQRIACGLAAALPPLLLFGLLLFHLPALYPHAERLDALSSAPGSLLADDQLSLAAAEIDQTLQIGKETTLTLEWQALNDIAEDYTINTTLIIPDPAGWQPIAPAHNSFPGQGMNPTRGWAAGDVYRDRLTLVPQNILDGPTRVLVLVGLQAAARQTDPVPVAETIIRPVQAPTISSPLAEPVLFGEAIRLVGAETEMIADQQQLTLYWQADNIPAADYTVFVHLVDAGGQMMAQADGPPMNGLSPTSRWQAGDSIRDRRELPPRTEPAPSGQTLLIGLYHSQTGNRLPATQAGMQLTNNAFSLPLK